MTKETIKIILLLAGVIVFFSLYGFFAIALSLIIVLFLLTGWDNCKAVALKAYNKIKRFIKRA